MATEDALLDYYPTGEVDGQHGPDGPRHARRRPARHRLRERRGRRERGPAPAHGRPQRLRPASGRSLEATSPGHEPPSSTSAPRITTVVIAVDGSPRLVRSLPSGGQNVTGAVAGTLRSPRPTPRSSSARSGSASPFRRSVRTPPRRSARSSGRSSSRSATRSSTTRRTSPVPRLDIVVLTGGGSHLPGLGQYLASASRLPVTVGDPLAGLRSAKCATAGRAARPRVVHLPVRGTRVRSCRMSTLLEAAAAQAGDDGAVASGCRRSTCCRPRCTRPARCASRSSGSRSSLAARRRAASSSPTRFAVLSQQRGERVSCNGAQADIGELQPSRRTPTRPCNWSSVSSQRDQDRAS